jgi:putative transposase
MPRSARCIIPDYPYHLTHRGNNKQQIFFKDADYRRYLYWFEEARKEYRLKVLAFCLMPNHMHLVGIASESHSFAKVINVVHARYAQYFHREYGGVGHLWQGRYFSCLLDQTHLLAALRYVERNPTRANLSFKPWDWVWSSAREHVKGDRSIIFLEDCSKLVSISSWESYIDVQENLNDINEIRKQTNARKAWGSDEFKKHIEKDYNIELFIKKAGRKKSGAVPN